MKKLVFLVCSIGWGQIPINLAITPTSLPPSGPAGGKLSGTYPNPGLNAACGDLSNAAAGCSASSLPPNGAAGGDLSGTYPNPGVAKVNGVSAANYALLDSPAFINTPTAPTQAATDNSTRLATDAYVTTAIANAINAAAGRDLVTVATAAVLPNTPTFTHVDSGIGSFLTSSTNSVLVVDGYTPVLLDRILVKNQAIAANNGIYSVTQLGVAAVAPWILTRTIDYDQVSDINNTIVPVANHGTTNPLTSWIMTSTVATVDTDAINFAAFTPSGANIVTASSPGAGIGRFAGGTQNQISAELSGDATTSGSNVVSVVKVNGNIPGNTCTNQFTRSIDTSARGTCASIVLADLPNTTPGTNLNYTEFTSNVTISATSDATATNIVTAGAVTFDGSTSVNIDFYTEEASAASNDFIIFVLYDGASSIGTMGVVTCTNQAVAVPVFIRRKITPSNASHTYSIRGWRGAVNGTVFGGAGGAGTPLPGYISITKF